MKRILLALVIMCDLAFGNFVQQLGSDLDGDTQHIQSGESVSLSSDGSIVAIGTPHTRGNINNAGLVRIYQWNGSSWNQLGSDLDGETYFNGNFGRGEEFGSSVALSSDGSIVAIGAPKSIDYDYWDPMLGQVRIYQWNGSSWNQLGGDIGAPNRSDSEAWGISDDFGHSVALSSDGSIVAIGAPFNDRNGSDSGLVRLYQWNGSSWNQLGSDIDGEASDDWSGYSVALSSDGSIVAIGAPDRSGNSAGHVRLYQWNGSSWNKLGNDIDGEVSGDESGRSVALNSDGSIVAIGTPFNNEERGHVRLYQWNGFSWNQLGSDIDGWSNSQSGRSVALSSDGSIVAIGAWHASNYSGQVILYQWNGSSWNQLGNNIDGEARDDFSGGRVALSSDGSIVAIGAHSNDGNIERSNIGHVRVYKSLLVSDGDDDGLSDYVEINIYSTNPNNADSDADGFNDSYEVNKGYDPTQLNSTPDTLAEIQINSETNIQFIFSAASGQTYRIESTSNLLSDFELIEDSIYGTGTSIYRLFNTETHSNIFFKAVRD